MFFFVVEDKWEDKLFSIIPMYMKNVTAILKEEL